MQICVLSDLRLASTADWQDAINDEGFSLHLPESQPLADRGGGNLFAQLRDETVEIDYTIVQFSELKDAYKNIEFGRDWKVVVEFTWFAKLGEGAAAWMAATAYARATGGVVFDEQEGKLFTPADSLEIAKDIERSLPEMEAMLRNYVQRLSPKSPEAEAALRAFMRRRSKKSSQA